jgi:hypothetical protein
LPGLHVILGDSAGGTFTRIYHARDRLLIDQDVLCCGPTPRCDDLRAWRKVRDDFWNSLVPGADFGHVESPFNLIDHLESLRLAEQTCVWAATSLSEQLFIAHVIHLADLVGADLARISVIQFESLGNRRARVLGMGELNEEYMSAHPAPVPLSKDTLADYRAAWRALTSDDPNGFAQFAHDRPAANTWLKNAMQLMLRRLPDARSGLSHWDSTLLRYVRSHGPKAARIIGYAMGETFDEGDLTGDAYLFGRLLGLGLETLPQPLLSFKGDRTQMGALVVSLTPFGESVLEGRAAHYPTNPIDDWAGGTRLSSAEGKLWFNDAGKIRRTAGPSPAPGSG